MGFFGRSRKVKKDAPSSPPPPLPPSPSRAPRTPQTPQTRGGQSWSHPQYQPPLHQTFQPSQGWYPNDAYVSQAPFHPAGLLMPPPPPPQPPGSYPPIIVNQHHYYLAPSSAPTQTTQRPHTSNDPPSKLNLGSVVDLVTGVHGSCVNLSQCFDDGVPSWHGHRTQILNQSAALVDQMSKRLSEVLTFIDGDRYTGDEKELFTWQTPVEEPSPPTIHVAQKGLPKSSKKTHARDQPKGQTTAIASSIISGNYFAKVDLYANSRLPMDLPPLKLYIPTYPLLCLAAQYSERVYERPRGAERDAHVDADWRAGTKAMVIKSVPMDYMNTIVFAIRGTATFMDWAVNLNTEPTSPLGFLDDPGNFCHSGFLAAARKMISPVAQRLRQLLQQDPGRASYSLLITGHSAGGAVAALLYSHMLSTSKAAESELSILTGCFKRIHCITFGTPPISLMPLTKPDDFDRRPQLKKSLFLSFINEGDPVARADRAYVKSLLELLSAPAPVVANGPADKRDSPEGKRKGSSSSSSSRDKSSKTSLATSAKSSKSNKSSSKSTTSSAKSRASVGPVWKVPPSTLSSAGRIVVLRSGNPRSRLTGKKTVEERLNEGVVAHTATDEQLRGMIWGDPVAHVMKLYAGRIETLAVGAVTARGY
ncbi:Alpha/Beta hydrolase protein [Cercophora scortea]|uniref:Alpha/Beta hydrolase protein n=1 Tax=Cercophora scortea TaxID=314031 RepID=A0AAE0MDM0_9PEZI|nr:Alpha/Beta hydrolase protein [Cercophora scortea]